MARTVKTVTPALAAKVRQIVADRLGMDPDDFRIYPGDHEGLSGHCMVIGTEGHYPTASWTRGMDYWTDAIGYDRLNTPLAALGVFLEPANVCNAGIIPLTD